MLRPPQDLLRDALELPQRRHATPHLLLDHLATRQADLRRLRPTSLQEYLKQAPHDTSRRLRDENHVRVQGVARQVEARDV